MIDIPIGFILLCVVWAFIWITTAITFSVIYITIAIFLAVVWCVSILLSSWATGRRAHGR